MGPQVGEKTRGGLPHLTCKRDHIKMRDHMDRQVTPPKRVTSPTWGPPPPCKQAFRHVFILFVLFRFIFFFSNTTLLNKSYTCTVNNHKRQSATKQKLQVEADKKKPNTIKILVVTKIKWEHNQSSKQSFIPYLKEKKKQTILF